MKKSVDVILKQQSFHKLRQIIICIIVFIMVLSLVPAESVEAKSKIKLNKTKATIYVGKSLQLKVKGTSKKAKWSSSNKKIAKVSQKGKVTGIKTGTAKITAKIGKKKYTCKVTVKKEEQVTTEQKTTEQATTQTKTETSTETTTEERNNNSTNETPTSTTDTMVKIQSITAEYEEAIIEKGTSVYPLDVAKQLGITLHYSNGDEYCVNEYGQYKGWISISEVDTDTAGDYVATFACTYEGVTVSIPIKISVCDKQENDAYRYLSNGRIAVILMYIGEDENISVPEKIDNAEVIGGILVDSYSSTVKEINLPKTWRPISTGLLFECETLESITVDADNKYLSSVEGVLFDKEQQLLCRYPENKSTTDYIIPDSVTEIRQGAFYLCKNFETITIPKSVTNLSKMAGYAVTPFAGCTSLKEIVVEDGHLIYKSVDGVLYADYEYTSASVETVYHQYQLIQYPMGKEDVHYEIPKGVNSIASGAFAGNAYIEELVIPDTVKSWGYGIVNNTDIKKIYLDIVSLGENQYISEEILGDGRTIYVKSEEMKKYIEDMLEENYWIEDCVVSDQFDW